MPHVLLKLACTMHVYIYKRQTHKRIKLHTEWPKGNKLQKGESVEDKSKAYRLVVGRALFRLNSIPP